MLRLGIVGAGRIAGRFIDSAWQKQGFVLQAIYSPRAESAAYLVQSHEKSLLESRGISPDSVFVTDIWDLFLEKVDAVYVASPHDTHFTYALSLLMAGKHVLCEKPMAFSTEEIHRLYKTAKAQNVVLMEALKTAYCPGFRELIQVVESGKIGEIVEVESCFTRLTPTNTREWTDLQYGGSFTELGSYVLFPVMQFLGTNYRDVCFHSTRHVNGLDRFTKLDFDYGEAFASCKAGMGAKSEGQLILTGTKGYILVDAPWWMTKSFQVRYEDPGKIEKYTFPYEGSGLQYECEAFYEKICCLQECATEEDKEAFWRYGLEIPEEISAAFAGVMEAFLEQEKPYRKESVMKPVRKIWAHRGCSFGYPENTVESFVAAANVKGCCGIELDVQLTGDGEVVVFHDENVSRVTDGDRNVAEYTLAELKELWVAPGTEKQTKIPTLEEVLSAMAPYCKEKGFLINIELKTGIVHYEGIEEKTYGLVKKYGLEQYIVYSSFWAESVKKMKELNPDNQTGMLAGLLSDCIKWGRYAKADALHPWIGGMDCEIPEDMKDFPVRAWNGEEPFYQDGRVLKERHLEKYQMFGVTEMITNVPELYGGGSR